jgi:hypothetical protein
MTSPSEPNNPPPAPAVSDLQAQLLQLQEELQRQQQRLAVVQAERDEYRRLLYLAVWQQFTEDELRRFAEDDNTEGAQPLEHFLGELEDLVNAPAHA